MLRGLPTCSAYDSPSSIDEQEAAMRIVEDIELFDSVNWEVEDAFYPHGRAKAFSVDWRDSSSTLFEKQGGFLVIRSAENTYVYHDSWDRLLGD
jgi:hypothetical protein